MLTLAVDLFQGVRSVLLLDMGEPVNVLEMAETMIALSGFEPYEEIDIVFTGARPGEKLREDLQYLAERPVPTPHEKLMVLTAPPDHTGFLAHARNLLADLPDLHDQSAASRLWSLVAPSNPTPDSASQPSSDTRTHLNIATQTST